MKDFLVSRFFYPSAFICLLVIFTACSQNKGDYNSLFNQGILPISPTNAYLGSNLFLGEEAYKSTFLYQFLKGRGAPGAIEIIKKSYEPVSTSLYYPKQSHYYIADLLKDEVPYNWIVKGPYMIEREVFRQLIDLQKYQYESSPFIIDGSIETFYKVPPTAIPSPTPRPVTPKPVIKAKKVSTPASKTGTAATIAAPTALPVSEIPSGPNLNSDQQAIRLSKGLVELSASGDLIHKVASDAQTLEEIATWFTGDSAKAKAIAEFNGLASGTPLAKDAKIRIPKDLSTTQKVMPK